MKKPQPLVRLGLLWMLASKSAVSVLLQANIGKHPLGQDTSSDAAKPRAGSSERTRIAAPSRGNERKSRIV